MIIWTSFSPSGQCWGAAPQAVLDCMSLGGWESSEDWIPSLQREQPQGQRAIWPAWLRSLLRVSVQPRWPVNILKLSWLHLSALQGFPSCVQACVCFGPVDLKYAACNYLGERNFIPVLYWPVFNNWLSGERPWFVAFAEYPGINTPTMTDFKLPAWGQEPRN